MIKKFDLLHEKLLELAEMRESRGEIISLSHILKEGLIDLRVIFLPDSFELFVHLLIKIIGKIQNQNMVVI